MSRNEPRQPPSPQTFLNKLPEREQIQRRFHQADANALVGHARTFCKEGPTGTGA